MDHERVTVDQFTAQAAGFAAAAAINQAAAIRMLLHAAQVRAADTVLDVACGPGIVAAAFAREAAAVTGIDLTPAMVELARERCGAGELENARFDVGNVEQLPYGDCAFTVVSCRYALHHLPDPGRVLGEMARVCATGGRVVVADVVVGQDPAIAARFNDAERARDPSHVRAMNAQEILDLMRAAGLGGCARAGSYRLAIDLDELLRRSASPNPAAVRERFERAIASPQAAGLGVGERREGAKILFHFPVDVFAGVRPQPARGSRIAR